jgi:hypothetical protein
MDSLTLEDCTEKLSRNSSNQLPIYATQCPRRDKISDSLNVEKTKVMRISRQPFPVKIMID